MNDLVRLLGNVKPIEPRGWFRCLHNHYFGRYGVLEWGLDEELAKEQWIEIEDRLLTLSPQERSELHSVVVLHAWGVGRLGLTRVIESFWKELDSGVRGSIVAGYTEFQEENAHYEWVKERLMACSFSPESACQIACNAIRRGWPDVLEAVLDSDVDLSARVHREDEPSNPKTRWSDVLSKLSHRLIDMVLEAALVRHDIHAIRLALRKGADPNIPVWKLERSYNEEHCPLSFAIHGGHRELAEMLLDAGASAKGNDFTSANYPLYLAIRKGWDDFAARLLEKGASISGDFCAPGPHKPRKGGTKSEVFSRCGLFFGHLGEELRWAQGTVGSLIELTPIEEKQAFYVGNGQGGQWRTILGAVVNNLERLKLYASLGLDTRLTAEELCTAIDGDAYEGLLYLLMKHGVDKRDRALFRIRRRKPEFGAVRREIEAEPQDDGCNSAEGFDPSDQRPLVLPGGTKFYVDLDAIAAPRHSHGSCLEGHFWLRVDEAIYRRRKGRLVVESFSKRWAMTKLPENRHQVDALLPCIKETPDGIRIRLGVSIRKLVSGVRDPEITNLIYKWFASPQFSLVVDEAQRRIRLQNDANSRPRKPSLSEDELEGYPPIFWPYLIRLNTGYIGMTPGSSMDDPGMLDLYEVWAQQNKTEDTFVPDPRLIDWAGWKDVPVEFKPFFQIDPTFGKPTVRFNSNNDYEKAMIHKTATWRNNWIIPEILKVLKENEAATERKEKEGRSYPK